MLPPLRRVLETIPAHEMVPVKQYAKTNYTSTHRKKDIDPKGEYYADNQTIGTNLGD